AAPISRALPFIGTSSALGKCPSPWCARRHQLERASSIDLPITPAPPSDACLARGRPVNQDLRDVSSPVGCAAPVLATALVRSGPRAIFPSLRFRHTSIVENDMPKCGFTLSWQGAIGAL